MDRGDARVGHNLVTVRFTSLFHLKGIYLSISYLPIIIHH